MFVLKSYLTYLELAGNSFDLLCYTMFVFCIYTIVIVSYTDHIAAFLVYIEQGMTKKIRYTEHIILK